MTTESERAVEMYLCQRGIFVERIAESADKSPDYRAMIDDAEVIIEVKQFDATEEELKQLEELKDGELLVVDATPGKGVRKKISDAASQLRGLAKDRCPALLILYNSRPFLLGNPANPYEILVGMYGFETIVLVRGSGSAPPRVKRKFGGSRKLTETHNTTISAIAVMEARDGDIVCRVYHNEHAACPLPVGRLARYGASEFVLSARKEGKLQEWVAINGA